MQVQRLPAYASYLGELIQETDPGHPDYEELTKAAARVKTVSGHLNIIGRISTK